jgi:hypothetical protein
MKKLILNLGVLVFCLFITIPAQSAYWACWIRTTGCKISATEYNPACCWAVFGTTTCATQPFGEDPTGRPHQLGVDYDCFDMLVAQPRTIFGPQNYNGKNIEIEVDALVSEFSLIEDGINIGVVTQLSDYPVVNNRAFNFSFDEISGIITVNSYDLTNLQINAPFTEYSNYVPAHTFTIDLNDYLTPTPPSNLQTLSSDKPKNNLEVNIYPNPAINYLMIESNKGINGIVTITDMNGKFISSNKLNSNFTKLDISTLTSGLYMLIMQTDNGTITKKVNIE